MNGAANNDDQTAESPPKPGAAGRAPRLAWILGLSAVVAWGASALYTVWGNPEIRYFRDSHRVKKAWADKVTRDHGRKVVVYGGSSCEFSIDGERMFERFALPCVNLGRGAGMGSTVLTMAALEETRSGDTLVVALEPALITENLDTPNLGIQFSVAVGQWNWIRSPLPPAAPISWFGIALALRPGGFHTFTMLGKLVRGQDLYRYKVQDTRPSGWSQTSVRLPISGPPPHSAIISEPKQAFFRSLADWCRARDVTLAYSLPWGYCPEENAATFQADNIRFLLQMARIMPVLKDPRLGAHSRAEDFADTAWHLNEHASALRTDELAEMLRDWKIWTVEELEFELSKRMVKSWF